MKNETTQIPWAYLFIFLAPLVLFLPFLSGNASLYWGTTFFQFYPWRKFALDTFRAGQIPLWNPYVGNGTPLIANYQSAVFYPLNWIALFLPLDYSFSWIVFIHLVLAGAGMAMFVRGLGAKTFGQVVAGLAFGTSQYLVARAGFLSINAAAAWLPWIMWSADRFLLSDWKGSAKYSILLAFFAALQLLAGHAQTTWYTYLLLAAWTIYRLITNFRIDLNLLRPLVIAAILLIAASIAAVQLLPTAEFLQQSQRATEYGYDNAVEYSYSPTRLLTLFVPDLFGNPTRHLYTGSTNYWEDANYIGLTPLLLALGYLFARPKLTRPRADPKAAPAPPTFPTSLILFFAIIILVSFLLALGKNTPVFPFFYQHVPTFNLFQAPTRMMIWFVFSLATLAGIAADEWTPPRDHSKNWIGFILMIAVLATLNAIAAYYLVPAGTFNDQIREYMRLGIISGSLLSLSLTFAVTQPAPKSPERAGWSFWVLVLISADLIYANWGLNPGAPRSLYAEPATPPSTTHRIYDARQYKYEYYLDYNYFGPPELSTEARALHIANTNMMDGYSIVDNYDPLTEERYTKFTTALWSGAPDKILQFMDVGMILTGINGQTVHLAPTALPPSRAWAVTSAKAAPDGDTALAVVTAAGFDPTQTVILEQNDVAGLTASAFPPEPPSASQSPTYAQIVSDTPNDVKIAASLPHNGWVVLADTYYPGWNVYVDGQPAKLLHVDYTFRAVTVPAGFHQVEFRYEPSSFRIGLLITIISLSAFVLACIAYIVLRILKVLT